VQLPPELAVHHGKSQRAKKLRGHFDLAQCRLRLFAVNLFGSFETGAK
jgi:hypothetical protein